MNRSEEAERIAKVIARAGLCSRRDAERWIADGRVSVNGETLSSPAFTVVPEDKIVVDGKPLPTSEATRLFLYHKPVGLVTTARDEKNRATVFESLPPGLPRVVSVGRLRHQQRGPAAAHQRWRTCAVSGIAGECHEALLPSAREWRCKTRRSRQTCKRSYGRGHELRAN